MRSFNGLPDLSSTFRILETSVTRSNLIGQLKMEWLLDFQRVVALSHLVEPLLLHMKPSSDISENILLQLHFTIHLMISPSHNRDLITSVLYQNEQPSNPFLIQL